MSDEGFWKAIAYSVSNLIGVTYHYSNPVYGLCEVTMTANNASVWHIYFGSGDSEDAERWQLLLRNDLLRYMVHPHSLGKDKIVVVLDSRKFGQLEVTFIPGKKEKGSFEIHLDAEEASC